MSKIQQPKTLLEAVRYFADADVCFEFVKRMRWPEKVTCPMCGCNEHSFLSTRKMWQCKSCKKQFSIKKGTIFEDSPLKLDKWLIAMWLIANAKNGISSYELHRSLGITQKSAWFMLHRIRLAMQNKSIEKLGGQIEADETYVGGKLGNMHVRKQKEVRENSSFAGKTIVSGILQRGGEVRTKVVQNTKRNTLCSEVEKNVNPGAQVFTDDLSSYDRLDNNFRHATVNHQIEFVNGDVHTNSLEGFWSQVKRTISGTYVSVEPVHLSRYLDEACYRYNNRKGNDADRFEMLTGMVSGKRTAYAQLTRKVGAA
ncbi:MAG: IS1595 family transposase [bacterium]